MPQRQSNGRFVPEPVISGWLPSSAADLNAWCDELWIPHVRLPVWVRDIYRHEEADVWSSSQAISPWVVYGLGLPGLSPDGQLLRDLTRAGSDSFFTVGINGHGVNSYAMGLVARGSGWGVAVQTGWGVAYRSPMDGPCAAAMVAAWNQTLGRLQGRTWERAGLMAFSDMRGIGAIFEQGRSEPDSGWDDYVGTEWRCLHAHQQAEIPEVQDLARGDENQLTAVLAELLLTLSRINER